MMRRKDDEAQRLVRRARLLLDGLGTTLQAIRARLDAWACWGCPNVHSPLAEYLAARLPVEARVLDGLAFITQGPAALGYVALTKPLAAFEVAFNNWQYQELTDRPDRWVEEHPPPATRDYRLQTPWGPACYLQGVRAGLLFAQTKTQDAFYATHEFARTRLTHAAQQHCCLCSNWWYILPAAWGWAVLGIELPELLPDVASLALGTPQGGPPHLLENLRNQVLRAIYPHYVEQAQPHLRVPPHQVCLVRPTNRKAHRGLLIATTGDGAHHLVSVTSVTQQQRLARCQHPIMLTDLEVLHYDIPVPAYVPVSTDV